MPPTLGKAAIVVALLLAIAGVLYLKGQQGGETAPGQTASTSGERIADLTASSVAAPETAQPATDRLPRLLELGADQCVPCKMMQPVLEELRKEYAGKLQVDFIDVWKDPAAGKPYGVQAIPTQIFFDADGKEIFRHTGYFAKEDIVAKFSALGVPF